jgi:hypothetical protein
MPSTMVPFTTNVKRAVEKFSLIEKHLLQETNFPFDIGTRRDF